MIYLDRLLQRIERQESEEREQWGERLETEHESVPTGSSDRAEGHRKEVLEGERGGEGEGGGEGWVEGEGGGVQSTGLAVAATSDPLTLFSLFFTPDIIRSIVEETNCYAALCLEGKPKTWKTSDEEIEAYFGFYILMGLVKEPEIRDY